MEYYKYKNYASLYSERGREFGYYLIITAELNLFFVVYDSYNNFPGVQLRVIVLPVWAEKHYTLVCLDLLMLESQVANYNLPVHLEND